MTDEWLTCKFLKSDLDGKKVYFNIASQSQDRIGYFRVAENAEGKLSIHIEYEGPAKDGRNIFRHPISQDLIDHIEINSDPSIAAGLVIRKALTDSR